MIFFANKLLDGLTLMFSVWIVVWAIYAIMEKLGVIAKIKKAIEKEEK